jgi:CRISPR-associated endonuclease/helicase Cas3
MTVPQQPEGPAAHSPNETGRWHGLGEHLTAVSARAREFGEKFGVGDWAALVGLWHDLGKYHPDFQQMLRDAVLGKPTRRVDHSTLGALHAAKVLEPVFRSDPARRSVEFLTLVVTATIAGHHAGLAESRDQLRERFDGQAERYNEMQREPIPPEILQPRSGAPLPPQLRDHPDRRLAVEFLVRMVLSTLVDADRLDTEAFASEGRPEANQPASLRRYSGVAELRRTLDQFMDAKIRSVDTLEPLPRAVHSYRQEVLAACRAAAQRRPGAFALDVATGGGKTLASLSFALRHAEIHNKDRVIVVIPFTSIIEQTAEEYRRALGELSWNVLEHHSAISEGIIAESPWGPQDMDALRRRLATENWDAPLVVTTGVQFFESLLSARPSRCRKLHSIANSVVVLDEAQTLPPALLNPTVWLINELVERYGTTVVVSTATQPSLEPPFPEVRNLRGIIPGEVARPPHRVRVELVSGGETSWPNLAAELAPRSQVLCIMHQRRDARELTAEVDKLLGDESTVHLSAAMCAAHRSTVLERIRSQLGNGGTCRVVSTQLVEAGVDLDFPVVYRALGGIDSMVQAAGRANREGRLGVEGGLLRIYRAPSKPPLGLPRIAADVADGLLREASLTDSPWNLFDPEVARSYFRRFYQGVNDKDSGVSNLRREFRFREVEKTYRFIANDPGLTVVVPYGEGRERLEAVHRGGMTRHSLRELQRFTVSLFPNQMRSLLALAAIRPLLPAGDPMDSRVFALSETHATFYDHRFGLLPRGGDAPASGSFVI